MYVVDGLLLYEYRYSLVTFIFWVISGHEEVIRRSPEFIKRSILCPFRHVCNGWVTSFHLICIKV